MGSKIKGFLHSFSFRAGALIFIAFCTILLTMRVLIYIQAIHSARNDIKEIVFAHSEAIQQSMEKHSISYIKNYIEALLENIKDKHIIIALRDRNNEITGNISEWPFENKKPGNYWIDFPLIIDDETSLEDSVEVDILANVINYPRGRSLLIGYDLKRLEIMQNALWMALVINAILSFVAALFITILMIFLLNRHMRKLNITCNEVLQGNSAHRVKLSGADDEFERLGKNFNAMLDRNEVLLGTIKDSTNALAHDMRTPLSRLRINLLKIIEKPGLSKSVQEELASSIGQVDKLVEMFQNILSIAKAESRTQTDIFITFDMVSLARDVIDFYATFIEDKNQELTTDIKDSTIIFKGDRQLVAQAILNLVDNAVKYTPSKGKISFTLQKTDESIICIIADSGPGIPEEYYEKVKERFFRLDESRGAEGTGLGMSLVDAVAKLHNGELRLDDNKPGLKASFILPL